MCRAPAGGVAVGEEPARPGEPDEPDEPGEPGGPPGPDEPGPPGGPPGAGAAAATTGRVGAENALVLPWASVAVTRTRRCQPTSALTTRCWGEVAPGMSTQSPSS